MISKTLKKNIISQINPKLFHAGGLKLRAISQKLQFSFRRKAQVRTILHFNLICPYHAKETPKERGRKPKPNKSGHSPLSPTVSPCLEKASTHLFPTLSPPLSPLLQFVFNFLFISCIEYCFVPFTAAPLICGLAFRYQVSAVSFAWLCGGDWVYCPPYFNQSANVLIALTVSKGIS